MQTKKQTHIEITTNQVLGIIIGYAIVYYLFPLFDHLEQAQLATVSTLLFFVSSYLRSYTVRRIFNK